MNIRIFMKEIFFFVKAPPIKAPTANPNKKDAKTMAAEIYVAPTIVTTIESRTTSYSRLAKPVENIVKKIII